MKLPVTESTYSASADSAKSSLFAWQEARARARAITQERNSLVAPAEPVITRAMLKKLYDEEMEKIKIPTYLGGGFEPPYGPQVDKST